MPTTNSKKKYINEWESHIDAFNLLKFTPSQNLSQEVGTEIEKLKALIRKVAEDKGLK